MSSTTPETMTPHEAARFMLELVESKGWTAEQVFKATGGRPDAEAFATLLATFRSPQRAFEFALMFGTEAEQRQALAATLG